MSHYLTLDREEDVSKTMYRDTTCLSDKNTEPDNHQPKAVAKNTISKVNTICSAFLAELENRTATNLQNIITSHVCKDPPDLEAGLLEVAKLQSMLVFWQQTIATK